MLRCCAKNCVAPARFTIGVVIPIEERPADPARVLLDVPLCKRHADGAQPSTFCKPKVTDPVLAVCDAFNLTPDFEAMRVRVLSRKHPRFLAMLARQEEQADSLIETERVADGQA